MVETAIVLLAAGLVVLALVTSSNRTVQDVSTPKETQNIKRLWKYVDDMVAKQRFQAAEKALLQILKQDHRNTAAYNRLGMLYVKQAQYDDAIACFDIASSLAPSVSSLYNLGLVHFQNGNYTQAALAMEKVIDLEPTTKRLMVFAKIQQHLNNHKKVIEAIQQVVELDPNQRNLEYLAESYENAKQPKKAEEVRRQITSHPVNQ